jgi:hypothetical protein
MRQQQQPAQAATAGTSEWSKHTASDGEEYYYQQSTDTSTYTYEKPPELMTDGEKTLLKCVWKEVVSAENGKTYYYDEETRQSVWEEPEELRVHKARIAARRLGLCLALLLLLLHKSKRRNRRRYRFLHKRLLHFCSCCTSARHKTERILRLWQNGAAAARRYTKTPDQPGR